MLQYSEKTVSKWECGACIPDIDVLFGIANIFNVSIEKLFEGTTEYFLGIDGGGTKTELVLTDEEGNVINTLKTSTCNPVDIGLDKAKGYLSSMFETDDAYIVHLLAADYDTDIDHHLDEIRYHRSRINYINKVEPIDVDGKITVESKTVPEVYTPFNDDKSEVTLKDGICNINLPEKCSYAILRFNK